MTYRSPVIGDWNNPYDRIVVKSIDIWDLEKIEIQNSVASTEYMAELLFAGAWRVNPEWLAWELAQNPPPPPPPDPEPEDPPVEPPVDPEPDPAP